MNMVLPKIEVGASSRNYGHFIISPLESGYGITLGNALRRVLLSALQGAAITAIQIEGVLHEFSTIAGVREDVTDIVLNLKALGLRMHSDTPKRMQLKAEGPCIVTAGMIETPHDIEIMDPDHVICHVDKGGKLSMDSLGREFSEGFVASGSAAAQLTKPNCPGE